MDLQAYINKDGQFDYELYCRIQEAGNRRKLEHVWANESVIRELGAFAVRNLDAVTFGLCHGTRRGLEQEWFSAATGAYFLGTEISSTATEFPNTIQWDFHDVKDEWIGAVDVIYSNSWDHAYDPKRCFTNWMRCLRPGGLCFVEHTRLHEESETSALDPFRLSLADLVLMLTQLGQGSFYVRTILSGFPGDDATYPIKRRWRRSVQRSVSRNILVVERATRELVPSSDVASAQS